MKLLFASSNAGKIKEVTSLLGDVRGIELLTLEDFPKYKQVEVEETGETFTENALLKATAFANLTQTLTIGEDSGLEVMTLDGRPGVYSKRYGSDTTTRNNKLISELANKSNRTARFVSIICLFDPKKPTEPTFFKGIVDGSISHTERGTDGFAYDFVFIPEGYEQTFAELGHSVKNQLSHRAKALAQLKSFLLSLKSEK